MNEFSTQYPVFQMFHMATIHFLMNYLRFWLITTQYFTVFITILVHSFTRSFVLFLTSLPCLLDRDMTRAVTLETEMLLQNFWLTTATGCWIPDFWAHEYLMRKNPYCTYNFAIMTWFNGVFLWLVMELLQVF